MHFLRILANHLEQDNAFSNQIKKYLPLVRVYAISKHVISKYNIYTLISIFLTKLFEKTLSKQNKKGSANQIIDIIPLENIDQRQDV